MQRRTFIATGLAAAAATLTGCAGTSSGGWIALFDGSGLDSFNPPLGKGNWRIEDRLLVGVKGDAGFLVSKATYRDVEIRAEFWADEDANSGIFVRCMDPNKITATNSYEVNIFDKRKDPKQGTGGIPNFADTLVPMKAANRWNTYEITLKGPQILVVLNGVKTVDIRNDQFPAGNIALQSAGGTIKFRKVEVRPL